MIPLAIPNLTGNEAQYLQDCIESGFVSSVGPFVTRLEKLAAVAAGAPHATATSSGTAGLHVALVAVGVKPGDLVILPSYTFIASANAIHQCGATPWLMDNAADRLTMDPDLVASELATHCTRKGEELIHKPSGRRVSALMPVHAIGQPADMDPLVDLARDHGLKVVADAAAALGSLYKDRFVGEFGADLSVLSFNGNKTFTSGGGGMILGDDADLIARVKHLSTTARNGPGYDHDMPGFNYRMTNIQAAVGCAQLERLGEFVAAKRHIQAAYNAALTETGLSLLPTPEGIESACWMAALLLDPHRHPDGDTVRAQLAERGVESRPFWRPMHHQAPYADAPRSPMTVCDALWPRVLSLPCSTDLSEDSQQAVITALKEILA
ncbi:DegT/DnrJ/EryC1/StrS family aminotransferase [Magnetospira sp. QH-2]|uniref:DegT/DnrJ/EryC1/StrS family aminotransferase n=1 Tax=Magnetospira sp. (strain QH-2) TaxID=1288970 RepID=UPI0003E80F94|nr:DegT/DnrJ/EryC1/StrS family aminotransferase [Magnetospira sp. QH-2]CCQ75365.1 putative pyridoxal phosphate-dependent enzyme, DegT/DnrJ/EryC1/StrS family [Magnetospira sp. QH-2]